MHLRRIPRHTADRKIADAHVSGNMGAMSDAGFHRTGSGVRAANGLPAHGSQRENEQDLPNFGHDIEKLVWDARRNAGKQQSAEERTKIVQLACRDGEASLRIRHLETIGWGRSHSIAILNKFSR